MRWTAAESHRCRWRHVGRVFRIKLLQACAANGLCNKAPRPRGGIVGDNDNSWRWRSVSPRLVCARREAGLLLTKGRSLELVASFLELFYAGQLKSRWCVTDTPHRAAICCRCWHGAAVSSLCVLTTANDSEQQKQLEISRRRRIEPTATAARFACFATVIWLRSADTIFSLALKYAPRAFRTTVLSTANDYFSLT